MKIRFPIVCRRRRELPFSRKRYWVSNIIWWVYAIFWISVLVLLWYIWDVSVWYKLGISFILILGTPALTDLIKPYDQYRKEWEAKYKEKYTEK